MFTCETAMEWSDTPQFTQLVSDPGPRAPTAEMAACSEGGKTVATGTLRETGSKTVTANIEHLLCAKDHAKYSSTCNLPKGLWGGTNTIPTL